MRRAGRKFLGPRQQRTAHRQRRVNSSQPSRQLGNIPLSTGYEEELEGRTRSHRAALAVNLRVARPVAHPRRRHCPRATRKIARSRPAWKAVTEHNPADAAAFASLGVVLSRQQKYSEAASAYRKALALNPKLPGVELNLGLAEFKQGHFHPPRLRFTPL